MTLFTGRVVMVAGWSLEDSHDDLARLHLESRGRVPAALSTVLWELCAASRPDAATAEGTAVGTAASDAPATLDDVEINTKAAAVILGCRERNVRDLIHRGVLAAQRDGHGWRLLESDVQALRAARDERAGTAW